MFNFGRNRYFEKHSEYLAQLVGCKLADAQKFIKGHAFMGALWEIHKVSGSKDDIEVAENVQSLVEMLIETHDKPGVFDTFMSECTLDPVVSRMLAAKAAAHIIGEGRFSGNEGELEKFKFDCNEFCALKLNVPGRLGGVSIIEIFQDPFANIPISSEAKKTLLGD